MGEQNKPARDISGQAPGGARQRLADALPLDTPFVVQVFPVYSCNFKCGYCIFSVEDDKRGFISDKNLLDFDLYRKCVDEMTAFPRQLKVLRFVGIGEPLLHKKIVDMVAYTVQRGIAQTTEIVTNGLLLNQRMVDGLVAAGLKRLVISIQGTSAEKYREVADAKVDFDRFLDNLDYLFRNRGGLHVYIKIIDTALDDEAAERKYYELFSSRCDTIAVERTVPIHKAIDFSGILKESSGSLTQFGLPLGEVRICPQPFFHMQINPDGKVVPCYSWEYPVIVGDCNSENLVDIWNGEKFRAFRRAMLDGTHHASESCVDCNIIKYRWFPEDDLSGDAERLKPAFDKAAASPGKEPA